MRGRCFPYDAGRRVHVPTTCAVAKLFYETFVALGFQAHLLSMPHASTASDCRRSCKIRSTRLGHDAIAAAILVTRCLLANAAVIHEYVLCCITHSHRARMRTQVHATATVYIYTIVSLSPIRLQRRLFKIHFHMRLQLLPQHTRQPVHTQCR